MVSMQRIIRKVYNERLKWSGERLQCRHTSNAAPAAETEPQVDNNDNDCDCPDCMGNGEYENPNPVLKAYLDSSRAFPYSMDSVQALINFANSASMAVANTGRLLEMLMREARADLSAVMVNGNDPKSVEVLRSTIKKFGNMNDDLKVVCLSVNAMAAALIITAKEAKAA